MTVDRPFLFSLLRFVVILIGLLLLLDKLAPHLGLQEGCAAVLIAAGLALP